MEDINRLVAQGNRLKENARIEYDKRLNKFHLISTYEAAGDDEDEGVGSLKFAYASKRFVRISPAGTRM